MADRGGSNFSPTGGGFNLIKKYFTEGGYYASPVFLFSKDFVCIQYKAYWELVAVVQGFKFLLNGMKQTIKYTDLSLGVTVEHW